MKILAIQNRMGIGDTVIFLPFIKAISEKFNSPVSLLVKESSKADQYLSQTNYIDEIILLKRNNKNKDRHDGLLGFYRLVNEIKKSNFEKLSGYRFSIDCVKELVKKYPKNIIGVKDSSYNIFFFILA